MKPNYKSPKHMLVDELIAALPDIMKLPGHNTVYENTSVCIPIEATTYLTSQVKPPIDSDNWSRHKTIMQQYYSLQDTGELIDFITKCFAVLGYCKRCPEEIIKTLKEYRFTQFQTMLQSEGKMFLANGIDLHLFDAWFKEGKNNKIEMGGCLFR